MYFATCYQETGGEKDEDEGELNELCSDSSSLQCGLWAGGEVGLTFSHWTGVESTVGPLWHVTPLTEPAGERERETAEEKKREGEIDVKWNTQQWMIHNRVEHTAIT